MPPHSLLFSLAAPVTLSRAGSPAFSPSLALRSTGGVDGSVGGFSVAGVSVAGAAMTFGSGGADASLLPDGGEPDGASEIVDANAAFCSAGGAESVMGTSAEAGTTALSWPRTTVGGGAGGEKSDRARKSGCGCVRARVESPAGSGNAAFAKGAERVSASSGGIGMGCNGSSGCAARGPDAACSRADASWCPNNGTH